QQLRVEKDRDTRRAAPPSRACTGVVLTAPSARRETVRDQCVLTCVGPRKPAQQAHQLKKDTRRECEMRRAQKADDDSVGEPKKLSRRVRRARILVD
ncbi:MAG: hypothetical protein ACPIOQ_25140, partial [Promethearchaeia archaeon]